MYAAAGGTAVLLVVLTVSLVLALNANSNPPSGRPGSAERLAARPAPPPDQPAESATAATTTRAPENSSPLAAAPAAASTEPPVSAPAPARPAAGAPLSTAQIVKRCEPSVALIKGKVSSGTGFLIGYGIIATNAHVIEDEFVSNLEVRFPSAPAGNQGPIKGQLLYEDRKRDLAFISVESALPVLKLAPNYSFVKGEDILVIGNPGLGDNVVLENAISRGVMSAKTVIEGMNYHQMNISINPGNSGGPVFDSQGRVIGVATLKSNKTEAMGFCIPVEDVNAALTKLGKNRPELGSRHRALVAFRILTMAGALYTIGLEVRASILRSAPAGGSDANLMPNDEVRKLNQALTSMDEKLFSLVDSELPALSADPSLRQTSQQGYQDLAANYQAMKRLYNSPNRLADMYFSQIQNLKAQHLRLIQALTQDLKVDVDARLLAVLQPRSMAGQPPTMVAEFVPFQMQPRLFGGVPGFGPQMPMGPPGMQDPLQAAREHRRQIQQDMRKRMRGFPGAPR